MAVHDKFTDAELAELVQKSSTRKELVSLLGYKSNWSLKQITPRLQRLGLVLPPPVTSCKHTDEELQAASIGCLSVTQVMGRLGLTPTGWAHKRFTERLKKLGITFEKMLWSKRKNTERRRAIDEYLVLDGPVITSSKLRSRLIEAGYKLAECEGCRRTHWSSKISGHKKVPIRLELDHINGNRQDNRLSNLRILCSNCHALTETHSKIK